MKKCVVFLAIFILSAVISAHAEGNFKRIMVIANKNWEVAPMLDVLSEPPKVDGACPPNFPTPYINNNIYPFISADISHPVPRMVFGFTNITIVSASGTNVVNVTNIVHAEIWCIQDWMNPGISSSSSKEKMRVLPLLFKWNGQTNSDIVIAFGTASFPNADNFNGDVVLGANSFIHDPFSTNTDNTNYWHDTNATERLIPLATNLSSLFGPTFIDPIRTASEARFIIPPMDPAHKLTILAAMNNVAVSGINIFNYDDYAWADPEALAGFAELESVKQNKPPVGSLETTHGLIALTCAKLSCPFIFVSAITDRVGYFNMEVATRTYAQNFACAHNAGVVVAWLLPQIATTLN